mgnify:CR=1 FL=1
MSYKVDYDSRGLNSRKIWWHDNGNKSKMITFKNGKIDQFLSQIDLSDIVMETDAPYLSPVPFRGKRNESVYLLKVLEKVADIYDLEKEKIAEITTKNALDIFKIF